jgi:hypothetical protein
MTVKTNFADPQRTGREDIISKNALLKAETTFLNIFGAVSGIAAVLDSNRQIVYANESFLQLIGIDNIEPILGRKPGEAVSCIHSDEKIGGCGTAEACAYCGAVNSIIESQLSGKKSVRETRITSSDGSRTVNWDLRVTTSPVEIRDNTFYVFSVEDISNEKRRLNLERIFFHDILNSAGNLNGLLSLLMEESEPDREKELIAMSALSSNELLEEILNHKQLREAENGDLRVKIERINPSQLMKSISERMSATGIAADKRIETADRTGAVSFLSDRILLSRILINMLKNALEASEKGETVTALTDLAGGKVRFSIHNSLVMPHSIRLQVFQRSFSTKGIGRGVGTYSIKLLTETYLKGTAGFSSSDGEGTTFWIDLPADGIR